MQFDQSKDLRQLGLQTLKDWNKSVFINKSEINQEQLPCLSLYYIYQSSSVSIKDLGIYWNHLWDFLL